MRDRALCPLVEDLLIAFELIEDPGIAAHDSGQRIFGVEKGRKAGGFNKALAQTADRTDDKDCGAFKKAKDKQASLEAQVANAKGDGATGKSGGGVFGGCQGGGSTPPFGFALISLIALALIRRR